MTPAKLIHMESGRALADRLDIARATFDRMRGLLGRGRLPPGEGIFIERCSSIHTFFMKFAIDVLFVDADLAVTRIIRGLRPWRLAAALGAKHVVELPAGTLDRLPVAQGDTLRIEGRT